MLFNSKAIVFRTTKYGETSLVVKMYTQERGLVSYLVNGVRKAKAKNKASLFQPLTILNIESYYKEQKSLQRLKEYKLDFIYQSLPFHTIKSSIGLFLLEVLNKTIKEEEQNEELFDFIYTSLVNLDQQSLNPNFHLVFLKELSVHLGFSVFGELPDRFFHLEKQISQPITNNQERRNLLKDLEEYYKWHVEGLQGFKSLEILSQVLQ